jgi:anti-sigma factor RsiW
MSVKGHSRTMEWLVMQEHDGQLPERHRAAVDAHLADCRSCRTYLATTRSVAAWLRSSPAGAAPSPEFSEIWRGVAGRLPASGASIPWRNAWPVWAQPFRWGWLAAGSLAVAVLLFLVNPYARLPLAQSHAATVTFVESSDYPVMVMMPSQPNDMTVIWLLDSPSSSSLPPT